MKAREYVLDTSAAVKLVREEIHSPGLRTFIADAAPKTRFIVPDVFPFEVCNVIARSVRDGQLMESVALATYEHIMAIVRVVAVAPQEALRLATRHDLSVYDAAFLALAGKRPLVTYDARLGRHARTWIKP